MAQGIIVDSCCDMTESMKKEMQVTSIPLTMLLGDDEYVDDESLDLSLFMRAMKACRKKVSSASPPPRLFQKAIEDTDSEYIITLSDKVSGTYGSAVLGSEQAFAETGHGAYVFNSKSGCAGETLAAIKLYELISEGLPKTRIIKAMQSFIDEMKTYFVLENYDNLQKNGRLSKIAGSLIHILNIKLIMGTDGEGNISLFEKVRGAHVLRQMLSLIEKSEKNTTLPNLVITHNNNIEMAEKLCDAVRQRFTFKKIFVVPTGGLSSMYADDKGIVMAF